MKFAIILLILAIAIVVVVKAIINLIEKSLMKKKYKLTSKSSFLFTIITIFLLAMFIGRKVLYNLF
jgi:hypothetical protein